MPVRGRGARGAAVLRVRTQMLSSSHLVDAGRERTGVGGARDRLPPLRPFLPPPVCRVATTFLSRVLISEQIAVQWEPHAVTVPGIE